MVYCVVPYCNSDTRKEKISFHEIPNHCDLRQKWLRAISRQDSPLVVSCLNQSIRKTRSGRLVLPPLAWWARERMVTTLNSDSLPQYIGLQNMDEKVAKYLLPNDIYERHKKQSLTQSAQGAGNLSPGCSTRNNSFPCRTTGLKDIESDRGICIHNLEATRSDSEVFKSNLCRLNSVATRNNSKACRSNLRKSKPKLFQQKMSFQKQKKCNKLNLNGNDIANYHIKNDFIANNKRTVKKKSGIGSIHNTYILKKDSMKNISYNPFDLIKEFTETNNRKMPSKANQNTDKCENSCLSDDCNMSQVLTEASFLATVDVGTISNLQNSVEFCKADTKDSKLSENNCSSSELSKKVTCDVQNKSKIIGKIVPHKKKASKKRRRKRIVIRKKSKKSLPSSLVQENECVEVKTSNPSSDSSYKNQLLKNSILSRYCNAKERDYCNETSIFQDNSDLVPKIGTLKRKKFLFGVLSQYNIGYEDDIFELKTHQNVQNILKLGEHLNHETDVTPQLLKTPKNAIFDFHPVSERKTPLYASYTSPCDSSLLRKDADTYMYRRSKVLKENKLTSKQTLSSKCSKPKTMPQNWDKLCNHVGKLQRIEKNIDDEDLEDYYFSDKESDSVFCNYS